MYKHAFLRSMPAKRIRLTTMLNKNGKVATPKNRIAIVAPLKQRIPNKHPTIIERFESISKDATIGVKDFV